VVCTQSHLLEHPCDVFMPPKALCDTISLAAPLQNDALNFMPSPASALCSAIYSLSVIPSALDHWAFLEASGAGGASRVCGGLLLWVCMRLLATGSGAWECVTSCDWLPQIQNRRFYFVAGWALTHLFSRC